MEAAGEDGEALPTGDSLNITVLMNRKEEFRSRITRVVLQHHKVREREKGGVFVYPYPIVGFLGFT